MESEIWVENLHWYMADGWGAINNEISISVNWLHVFSSPVFDAIFNPSMQYMVRVHQINCQAFGMQNWFGLNIKNCKYYGFRNDKFSFFYVSL